MKRKITSISTNDLYRKDRKKKKSTMIQTSDILPQIKAALDKLNPGAKIKGEDGQ